MNALIQNAIRTSEIEGERLDVGSVRSSVARQLGLEQAGVSARITPESEALVELLSQSTHQLDEPLYREQLCLWQSMLFVQSPDLLGNVRVGELHAAHPMHVVSGHLVVESTQTAMPWNVHKVPAGEVYKIPDKVTLSDFF